MFSTNGRIKSNKEVGVTIIENIVICERCCHEFATRKKTFGEKVACPKCGSTKLILDQVKK